MTSPQLKILLSLAGVSIVYAFICEIRMTRKARELATRLRKERPDLWSELNLVARNWNGGLPGLKFLKRKKAVDLPGFDLQFEEIRALERQLLRGVAIGSACLFLVFVGLKIWGWTW